MAVQKKKKKPEDRVEFYAFKDNDKYKDDIFVGKNGKPYRIQRGKRVKIPKSIAAILENSQEQDARTANLIEKEQEAYRVASERL